MGYDFKIIYRRGIFNISADEFSRYPFLETKTNSKIETELGLPN